MTDRLMTITRHDGDELRINMESYKGHTFLSLRTYFDAGDGVMKPTKKGVSVPLSALGELQNALARATGTSTGPRPSTVTSLAAHRVRADLKKIQRKSRRGVGSLCKLDRPDRRGRSMTRQDTRKAKALARKACPDLDLRAGRIVGPIAGTTHYATNGTAQGVWGVDLPLCHLQLKDDGTVRRLSPAETRLVRRIYGGL